MDAGQRSDSGATGGFSAKGIRNIRWTFRMPFRGVQSTSGERLSPCELGLDAHGFEVLVGEAVAKTAVATLTALEVGDGLEQREARKGGTETIGEEDPRV